MDDSDGKFWSVVVVSTAMFLIAGAAFIAISCHDEELTRRACLQNHSAGECATLRLR
jgi:hypothetical protein